MNDPRAREERLERIAESFMCRLRDGERPSVQEYADQYPELADDIQELFPTFALLENYGPEVESPECVSVVQESNIKELGEYRILREIGRGGMGVVYEAEQASLGRKVALKVLSAPASHDQNFLKRFHHEARAAAQLHHTNIVPVFGVGQHDGVHYYAMQFIQGQSLDRVLQELRDMSELRPGSKLQESQRRDQNDPTNATLAANMLTGCLPQPQKESAPDSAGSKERLSSIGQQIEVDTVVSSNTSSVTLPGQPDGSGPDQSRSHYYHSIAQIGEQVADALGYAHGKGILHRDIKPSNLLLDMEGTVWVTDLGLAKSQDEDLTNTGDIVGTLRYMAPERFRRQADERADIYSLGMTLYEMLVLRPAFEHQDRARLIKQVTHDEPPAIRKLNPHVPRDLETIVVKSMAKDPTHRYQSAEQLARDLRWFLEDKPIRARPVTATERAWRWCRRNPALATLTATVSVLAVVATMALGLSIWFSAERDLAVKNFDRATRAERAARDATVKQKDATRQATTYRLLAQARADRWSERAGHRFRSLESLAEASKLERMSSGDSELPLALRNEAIASMALTDVRQTPAWSTPPLDGPVIFDFPRKRYILRAGPQQDEIVVKRMSDHDELLRIPGFGITVAFMVLSPDGRFLATKYHDESALSLVIWDLNDGTECLRLPQGIHEGSVAFSNDSQFVFVGHANSTIQRHALLKSDSGASWNLVKAPSRIACHPSEPTFAVCSVHSYEVEVRSGSTGQILQSFRHADGIYSIAWSPDGRLLACGCNNHRIYVWDTQSNELLAELKGHQAPGIEVSFGPDSHLLTSFSWDDTTRFWNPWTGRHHVSISGRAGQFDSSGERLAFALDSKAPAGIWEIAGLRECRTLGLPKQYGRAWAIDIDATGLIAIAFDRGVQLWELSSNKPVAFLPIGKTLGAVFHPVRRELYTSGEIGIWRWPITAQKSTSPDTLLVGPPEKLREWPDAGSAAISRDGRMLAIVRLGSRTAVRIDLDGLIRDGTPVTHPLLENVAVSNEGRWLTTGTWRGNDLRVWDAETGDLLAKLNQHVRGSKSEFDPLGRWLAVTSSAGFDLYELGEWVRRRRIERTPHQSSSGCLAFSPDGEVMAVVDDSHLVRLVSTSGKTLAVLEPGYTDLVRALRFDRQGSQLTVLAHEHLHIWDLELIRHQLAEMDLDWQAPSLVSASAASTKKTIEREALVQLGPELSKQEKPAADPNDPETKVQRLTATIEANPDNADAYYDRGVVREKLGETQEAESDFRRALELYSRRIDRDPADTHAYHYRGHVRFHLREFQLAADDFSFAIERTPDSNHLLFSRAEALWHVDPTRALSDYQRGMELGWEVSEMSHRLAWVYVAGPEELRDPVQALALARKLVKSEPENRDYQVTLAAALMRNGRHDEALRVLKPAIQVESVPVEALLVQGICLVSVEQFDQAESLVEQIAEQAALTTAKSIGNIFVDTLRRELRERLWSRE